MELVLVIIVIVHPIVHKQVIALNEGVVEEATKVQKYATVQ